MKVMQRMSFDEVYSVFTAL